MNNHAAHTALVTGASSGVGWEAAAQLAEAGYGRVIVTARTPAKAEDARTALLARVPGAQFVPLALDLNDFSSIEKAAQALVGAAIPIDALILNAGVAATSELRRTADGIEQIMAATLTGHHALTMHLLRAKMLSGHARIIIAGSEAARGDVPTFSNIDVQALAAASFGGDLERAIEAVLRADKPVKFANGTQYATAKTFAVWWAKELATQLPAGMTVNTVSPGNTPDTKASREMPAIMRRVMLPVMKLMPSMWHSVPTAAARYLTVIDMPDGVTGQFFASPPQKMTGPVTSMTMSHFTNVAGQRALWNVVSRLAVSGGASTR
ncbi:SDR family NAD(P)-dependent oxidoreductase [Salinibacterium sp. SWN1162]|uniref:SDR family NAD(P)-dependent oxidoreductase n=1 Tax=Salinibacterium sp. SWN1162 TaxID=2792053 RepID=UPI0018CFD3D0|nr:SDR family NAD(P)-dependent oxidoreductase [Salinibacterium sp. SWN1162]MBH0010037.1 SDR family NAD(P)-dependent oxidoreductase [Salinibacterium sp. SWN1162]